MFIQFILLPTLLIFLFFLSEKISTRLYSFVYLVTKSREFSLGVLAVLLLPGTAIHELAHFIIATVLRVPTGELTIFPTLEEDGEVKTGKLMLGKTDPFRHTIIGFAPMLIGLSIIYFIGKIFFPDILIIFNTAYLIPNILGLYLLLATSITMFSSKKDLESFWIAGPITFLVLITLYIVGVRIFLEETLIRRVDHWLTDLNYYLLITAAVNYLVLLFLTLNLFLWQKILRRKVHYG